MKKIFALVLVAALVLSLGVTAFAAGSVTPAAKSGSGSTAAVPVQIDEDYKNGKVTVIALGDSAKLSDDEAKSFKEAYSELKKATPDGMSAKFFFYQACDEAYTATYKISGLAKDADVAAKLFKDGNWTDLTAKNNGDGTVSVEIADKGPVAIFVGK